MCGRWGSLLQKYTLQHGAAFTPSDDRGRRDDTLLLTGGELRLFLWSTYLPAFVLHSSPRGHCWRVRECPRH